VKTEVLSDLNKKGLRRSEKFNLGISSWICLIYLKFDALEAKTTETAEVEGKLCGVSERERSGRKGFFFLDHQKTYDVCWLLAFYGKRVQKYEKNFINHARLGGGSSGANVPGF
jgi:hypothetical protein